MFHNYVSLPEGYTYEISKLKNTLSKVWVDLDCFIGELWVLLFVLIFFRRNVTITHDQAQHVFYEPFSEGYSLMISDVSISWLSHAIARIATCCVSAARCSGSVDPRMVLDGHPSCGQSAAQCTEDRQSHSGCWRVLKVPSSNLNWDWKTMVFMHGFPIENRYMYIYILYISLAA